MNPEPNTAIFRSLEDIRFGTIFAVLLLTTLGLRALEAAVSHALARLPDRVRFSLLPWPPLVRIVVLFGAMTTCVALVVRPHAQAFTALLGTAAVALGFAFKDLVRSVLGGVYLLFERPFVVGDWVEIGGYRGEVVAFDLRALRLSTVGDDEVTIPYGELWTVPVANATSGERRQQVVTTFFLDPSHDDRWTGEVLRDVALTSPFLDPHRPVRVHVEERRGATLYLIRAYPRDARDQFAFTADLTLRGRRALRRMGIPPAVGVEIGGGLRDGAAGAKGGTW